MNWIQPGVRVQLKGCPGVIGIAKSLPRGKQDIVKVYWGTQDGRAFIGDVPASQLEHPCTVDGSN